MAIEALDIRDTNLHVDAPSKGIGGRQVITAKRSAHVNLVNHQLGISESQIAKAFLRT